MVGETSLKKKVTCTSKYPLMEGAGKMVIRLYDDVVPKTCANFRSLCTGKVRPSLSPF